jgi:hypothetical protein
MVSDMAVAVAAHNPEHSEEPERDVVHRVVTTYSKQSYKRSVCETDDETENKENHRPFGAITPPRAHRFNDRNEYDRRQKV